MAPPPVVVVETKREEEESKEKKVVIPLEPILTMGCASSGQVAVGT
jgi:hypothetical protein